MDAGNEINSEVEPQKTKPKKSKVSDGETKIKLMKQINSMYQVERYVYIIISALAGVLVLINGLMMLKGEPNAASLSLLFGSGGLITISVSRLIFMWNKVVEIIFEQGMAKGEVDGKH